MEQSRLDFDDLRAFFLVAETGSFARAAQRLDSSKSIVSRRVARLEGTLSTPLLHRTSRGTHLTEAGQVYYDEARAALNQLEHAADAISQTTATLSGAIRLTAPVFFGSEYLAPLLSDFAMRHPKVELQIDFRDEKVDLLTDQYDIAIRLGQLSDSSLPSRRLCQSKRVAVASPGYLAQHPSIRRPEDIRHHAIVHYTGVNTQEIWRYEVQGEVKALKISPRFRSNSAAMLTSAAKAGVGLTLLPLFVVGRYVASGELEIVLPDQDWGATPVTVLLPQGRGTTRRVRALVDFLIQHLANGIP